MAYYYNLPLITDLTLDQQRAVNETKPLALAGGPGTGKSVVSLWRHIRNHSTGRSNSLLLTFTKTLEHYLRASAITQNTKAGNNIGRVFWWLSHEASNYQEIIIDEAQDVHKATFQRFWGYTRKISYGADERQSVYLAQDELMELQKWLETDDRFQTNVPITLSRNFRNSKEILLFTRSVFPDFMISQNTIKSAVATGLKPIMKVKLGWDIDDQAAAIVDIIKDFQSGTHNIAVLVPIQKMVDTYYSAIKAIDRNITITKFKSEDDDFEELSGVHITTFKSSKGTEFDTVIIPEFDRYKWFIENGHTVKEKDYFVAFTRTKINLFLLFRNNFPDIGDINTVTIE